MLDPLPQRSECWLAPFDPDGKPCDGPKDRAHLIPKNLIRRHLRHHGITRLEDQGPIVWHPAVWVCACRYHHGQLDVSKRLRVPRSRIPGRTEAWAQLVGLTWWLDREYGRSDERPDPPALAPEPADALPRPPVRDDDESSVGGGAGEGRDDDPRPGPADRD